MLNYRGGGGGGMLFTYGLKSGFSSLIWGTGEGDWAATCPWLMTRVGGWPVGVVDAEPRAADARDDSLTHASHWRDSSAVVATSSNAVESLRAARSLRPDDSTCAAGSGFRFCCYRKQWNLKLFGWFSEIILQSAFNHKWDQVRNGDNLQSTTGLEPGASCSPGSLLNLLAAEKSGKRRQVTNCRWEISGSETIMPDSKISDHWKKYETAVLLQQQCAKRVSLPDCLVQGSSLPNGSLPSDQEVPGSRSAGDWEFLPFPGSHSWLTAAYNIFWGQSYHIIYFGVTIDPKTHFESAEMKKKSWNRFSPTAMHRLEPITFK